LNVWPIPPGCQSRAGAGVGSFNHRFAMPGVAGNSVLSIMRLTDLPPFADEGLLAKSRNDKATPKIFHTASSTEYWAHPTTCACPKSGARSIPPHGCVSWCTSNRGKLTGLGLSIVDTLARRMGAKLELSSPPEGWRHGFEARLLGQTSSR
jgi:hypothetical protein